MPKKDELSDLRATVQAVRDLDPQRITAKSVRAIVGKTAVGSLGEVAAVFGVAPGTVQGDWRRSGMPGKRGHYSIADVLVWILERDAKNRQPQRNGSSDWLQRKQEAESRIAIAKAEQQEFEIMRQRESWLPREQVLREFGAMLAMFREELLTIPRQLRPICPQEDADTIVEENERLITHSLVALSERPVDKYLDRIEGKE